MLQMTLPTPSKPIDATLLPQLLELYLVECTEVRNVKPHTLENYRNYISPLLKWLDAQPTKLLDAAALVRYQRWLATDYRTSRGVLLVPTAQNDCFKRLRHFLQWCFANGCTGRINLANALPGPTPAKSHTHFPTIEELQRLLDAVEGPSRLRDSALIATHAATGARRSEIAAITRRDLHFEGDAGYIHLRHTKSDMDGVGPGRWVLFDATTATLLRQWVDLATPEAGVALFGLLPDSIDRAFRRHTIPANVPRLTPHALRRLFTEYWHEHAPADTYAALKLQLGHSLKRDVTQRHYLDPSNKRRILAAIRSAYVSPMSDIDLSATLRKI